MTRRLALLVTLLAVAAASPLAAAQQKAPPPDRGATTPPPERGAVTPPGRGTVTPPARGAVAPPARVGVTPPADYVIGPEDVLTIEFWRDDQISGEATVRPDGKITLKLLNDIQAAGLTPEQLREVLVTSATKFLEDPSATVIVKAINSRKVMVMGEVNKTGPLPLNGPMTVLQALGMAGGVTEYAQKNKIAVIRGQPGRTPLRIPFDYEAIGEGKKLEQNIYLLPGDTVFVP